MAGAVTLEIALASNAAASPAATAPITEGAGAAATLEAEVPGSLTGDTGRLPSSGIVATGAGAGAGAAAGGCDPPVPRRLGGGGVLGIGQHTGPAEPIRMLEGGREEGGVPEADLDRLRAVAVGDAPTGGPTGGLAGRTGLMPSAVAVDGLTLPPRS